MGGVRRDYSIGQEFQEVNGSPLNQVHGDVKEDDQRQITGFAVLVEE